ncbi:MAG: PHP domain-containing protein [Candidatus Aenigmarchaeota archaeon]|nr:PHP domain-containing protein [Candidatus Aenigmarchaeota archaeon]
MNYYDFHLISEFSEGESSIKDFADRAKVLGYKGICISEHFRSKKQMEKLKEECKKITKSSEVEVFLGFQARNLKELRKLSDLRREYDVLLVKGGTLNLNRKAVETPEVDLLLHPEFERRDSGFNHTMAKLAKENKVAIEINFREILLSSKNTRAHIIHNISNNVKLCKKYKAPLIICSGAFSHLQMKDPKVLISMGKLLGLELNEAKKSLSEVPEGIIKMIRERQSDKWVRPGVKVIE